MECEHCGWELTPGARFCASCGSSVPEGVVPERDSGGSAEPTRRIEATVRVEGVEGLESTDPQLPPVATLGDALSTCPRCGATNSARRLLCGSCGTDLQTGEPGWDQGAPAVGEEGDAPTDRGVRRTVAAVVAGAVLLGVVLGVVLLSTGVLGRDGSELPRPPAFSGPAERLAVRQVVASSAASGGSDPGLVADGDLATGWWSADGRLVGEVLELRLDQRVWIEELQLAVGEQSPATPFEALARPIRIRLRFGEDDSVIVELTDQPGVQSVRLEPPRRTDRLRLEILEIAPGARETSVAVAEVVARGHPADTAADAAPGRPPSRG